MVISFRRPPYEGRPRRHMVRSAHFAGEALPSAASQPARLAPLLGALSLATDLGAGNPTESALRTAVLATRIARALGISGPALTDVYYTALLRYLGCTGYAHEEAALAAATISRTWPPSKAP